MSACRSLQVEHAPQMFSGSGLRPSTLRNSRSQGNGKNDYKEKELDLPASDQEDIFVADLEEQDEEEADAPETISCRRDTAVEYPLLKLHHASGNPDPADLLSKAPGRGRSRKQKETRVSAMAIDTYPFVYNHNTTCAANRTSGTDKQRTTQESQQRDFLLAKLSGIIASAKMHPHLPPRRLT
eukprot:GSA25T00013378001.1